MTEDAKLLNVLRAMCAPLSDGVRPHVVVHGDDPIVSLGMVRGACVKHVPCAAAGLLAMDEEAATAAVAAMRRALEK